MMNQISLADPNNTYWQLVFHGEKLDQQDIKELQTRSPYSLLKGPEYGPREKIALKCCNVHPFNMMRHIREEDYQLEYKLACELAKRHSPAEFYKTPGSNIPYRICGFCIRRVHQPGSPIALLVCIILCGHGLDEKGRVIFSFATSDGDSIKVMRQRPKRIALWDKARKCDYKFNECLDPLSFLHYGAAFIYDRVISRAEYTCFYFRFLLKASDYLGHTESVYEIAPEIEQGVIAKAQEYFLAGLPPCDNTHPPPLTAEDIVMYAKYPINSEFNIDGWPGRVVEYVYLNGKLWPLIATAHIGTIRFTIPRHICPTLKEDEKRMNIIQFAAYPMRPWTQLDGHIISACCEPYVFLCRATGPIIMHMLWRSMHA